MRIKNHWPLWLALIIPAGLTGYVLSAKPKADALWEIVSRQCVPNQKIHHRPTPCLKVDSARGYVLFKDAKGPVHDLVLPIKRITGIESPALQRANVPRFFALAWDERKHLSRELGQPIKERYLSMAVNSKYGRSQNQLHIHLACLAREVYLLLERETIGTSWKSLRAPIKGHRYLARKLDGEALEKEDPFKLLHDFVTRQGDNIGYYGLAVVGSENGDLVLLANRVDFLKLNFGSAGEIQDYDCALALEDPSPG